MGKGEEPEGTIIPLTESYLMTNSAVQKSAGVSGEDRCQHITEWYRMVCLSLVYNLRKGKGHRAYVQENDEATVKRRKGKQKARRRLEREKGQEKVDPGRRSNLRLTQFVPKQHLTKKMHTESENHHIEQEKKLTEEQEGGSQKHKNNLVAKNPTSVVATKDPAWNKTLFLSLGAKRVGGANDGQCTDL